MKTQERRQWRHSGVFIVNCEYISHFAFIADLERATVSWVHIEKTSTFEKSIGYIMRYAAAF